MKKWRASPVANAPSFLASSTSSSVPAAALSRTGVAADVSNITSVDTASELVDLGDLLHAPSTGHPQTPEPLLIPKDIEALLEEDERRRSQQGRDNGLSTSPPYDSSFESTSGLVGLPAPPRGPRKQAVTRERSLRSRARHGGSLGRITVAMEASPGIQTPPLSEGNEAERKDQPASVVSASSSRPDSIQIATLDSAPSFTSDVMSTLDGKQSDSLPALLSPTAEHRRGDSILAQSVEGSQGSQGSATSSERQLSEESTPVNETSRCSAVFGVHSGQALHTSHATVESPDGAHTRPLLAHTHSTSRDSNFSQFTFSSHGPASTASEPRISISSTIYPPSANDSFRLPPPPPMPMHILDQNDRIPTELIIPLDPLAYEDASATQSMARSSIDLTSGLPGGSALSIPRFAGRDEISISEYSPIEFSNSDNNRRSSFASSSEPQEGPAPNEKPSLPLTPKPIFRRSRSAQPGSKSPKNSKPPSPTDSPKLSSLIPYNLLTSLRSSDGTPDERLPPTSNLLNAQERAELLRKTRKLTQMLGEIPSPISGPEDHPDSPINYNCLMPMMPTRKMHTRGVLSISDAMQVSNLVKGLREQRRTPDHEDGHRAYSPLSPITFRDSDLLLDDDVDSPSPYDSPTAQTPRSPILNDADRMRQIRTVIRATDSFIEFADTTGHERSPSSYSVEDSIVEEQKGEDERRRKRDRLAKLHRFLGARIPAELLLAPHEIGVPLPPLASDQSDTSYDISDRDLSGPRNLWKRRNSLAGSLPSDWLPGSERMKKDLNDKEKAVVVKRALKMEKVFGEQPPQNLYHSRQALLVTRHLSQAVEQSTSAPSSPVGRNVNKSAYRKGKSQRRSSNRPGTAESSKGLLNGREAPVADLATAPSRIDMHQSGGEMSQVYMHYRHSLISLADIVNRDDKESLAELHEYLNGDPSLQDSHSSTKARKLSLAERRRSLPLQTSSTSLASQYALSEIAQDISPFEVRRRRAAKLSHFFGVSYRDLFGDLLESIELGVREDGGRGTLNSAEVQDLLSQLRKLKSRGDELS